MLFNSVTSLIGKTPTVALHKILGLSGQLYAKLEYLNPSGSIKDRAVFNILRRAFERGELKKGMMVVEASSGNTGISLAMLSNIMGLRAKIVMPKGMSEERRKMIELLGAEVVEIDGDFEDAIKIAKLIAEREGAFYLGQFSRPENPEAYKNIALELKELGIKVFVAGVGTGGTLIGVAKHLRAKIVAVLPKERKHGIQGIGDWVKSDFWDQSLIDDVVKVSTKEARKMMRELWKHGLLVGRSSGANVFASLKFLEEGPVATILPDSWDRYISLEYR